MKTSDTANRVLRRLGAWVQLLAHAMNSGGGDVVPASLTMPEPEPLPVDTTPKAANRHERRREAALRRKQNQ